MARNRSKKWTSALAGVLVIALAVGAVVGVSSIAARDTTSIGASYFSRGTLDSNGGFVKSDTSIVSDYFECQGLTIEPEADATGTYQVYYYAEDKTYQACSDERTPLNGIYHRGDESQLAMYARIVITPSPAEDTNGTEESSFSIRFWEVAAYTNAFTITVDKKQYYKYASENSLLKDVSLVEGEVFWGVFPGEDGTQSVELVNMNSPFYDVVYSDWTRSEPVELPDGYSSLFFMFKLNSSTDEIHIILFDEDGEPLSNHVCNGGTTTEVTWLGTFYNPSDIEKAPKYAAIAYKGKPEYKLFSFENER